MRVPKSCYLILVAAAAISCATAPRPSATVSATRVGIIDFRVFESATGQFVPFSSLVTALAAADVVYFGEQHDDPGTHEAESAVLFILGQRGRNVILSLEMFERDVQPVLDQYLAGKTSEAAFLERSRPWERYATDYRALVERAKSRGLPVIAANVPRSIATDVSRRGLALLDSLPASQRANVARDISCPHDAYYDRFAQQMQSHGGVENRDPDAARAALQRFYEAQCVKDETMAESIVTALRKAAPGAVLLHVNGSFHSDFGHGTVQRVKRRNSALRTLVLTAVPVADPDSASGAEHAKRADYVLFTRAR